MSGQEGIDETFADITLIAERCRFRDCAHNGDEGCAVDNIEKLWLLVRI